MAKMHMNHTKRRISHSHKGNPKPKTNHKHIYIATPVRQIEWPSELHIEAPYAFDKYNRIYRIKRMKAVGLGTSKPLDFDAKTVPIYALATQYPNKD